MFDEVVLLIEVMFVYILYVGDNIIKDVFGVINVGY